ncbi:MAG: MotA/TolQ/ExbB proton channel family protein [Elusimicrobia bacterium]|nr:MotA/TolQ/ExbB proton channel family protein [Elusimicrobiota bacterium]MBK7544446.1 MotA/TolQ/ExbB proton channel family protein [Elusimicrobiota bacterium]MBK7573969.1 MotA/TolQ/ExbB proton channel family protein [Elusimicrobiota bacterium]MBK7689082.1 MotA/TolQ/ExbB proton channel family protein [Elusimicrobiota bacterium]MBK8422586.1 MotA/TolQ/ExbB proton channel family protein [Elusimicrobiota bacterium]
MGVLGLLVHSGGGWVIWLLMLASVLTLAVIVERAIVLRRERRAFDGVRVDLRAALNDGDLRRAADLAGGSTTVAASVLSAGLARPAVGPAAVEERLAAARIDGRYRLERRLWVLGTLGNNAPFVGLFGTVLGVIRAFADLAGNAGAGPEVVMAGLSEALVATAVGLLVAIPAVMAYNYFLKRAGEYLAETDALSRLLMAALKEKK